MRNILNGGFGEDFDQSYRGAERFRPPVTFLWRESLFKVAEKDY